MYSLTAFIWMVTLCVFAHVLRSYDKKTVSWERTRQQVSFEWSHFVFWPMCWGVMTKQTLLQGCTRQQLSHSVFTLRADRVYCSASTNRNYSTYRLQSCEQRRSELYAKQSRTNQFASREERDNWIRGVSFLHSGVQLTVENNHEIDLVLRLLRFLFSWSKYEILVQSRAEAKPKSRKQASGDGVCSHCWLVSSSK